MGTCTSTPTAKPTNPISTPTSKPTVVQHTNNVSAFKPSHITQEFIDNLPNLTTIELLMYKDAIEEKLRNCTLENTPKKTYKFTKAKVVKVYDGDTFTIVYNDNTGIKEEFIQNKIRLYGIDCCEIKDKDNTAKKKANDAKDFVKKLILNEIVDVEILNGKKVDGKTVNEKYGRLIGRVSFRGQDISTLLLQNNLAVKYNV